MPQTLTPAPYTHEPPPSTIKWTRHQCRAIQESGVLTGRYELIEGEIISKMGQKRPHAYVITRITAWLIALFGEDFVQFQLPILLLGEDNEMSEPEPDGAVLRQPAAAYRDETPYASEVLLVVEVSDSTLRFDQNTKAALYSRSGIPEYWVIDITKRQVFVYREPAPSGYQSVAVYAPDEEIATLARPEQAIRVADLLPLLSL